MRSIACGIVFLVGFTVSPSVINAQPATGWVLWEKTMTMRGSAETVIWEPQDGFETVADCRKSGQQLFQLALTYMKNGAGKLLGDVRPDGRSAVFAVTEAGTKKTVDIRYVCFPGPFDPRPRR